MLKSFHIRVVVFFGIVDAPLVFGDSDGFLFTIHCHCRLTPSSTHAQPNIKRRFADDDPSDKEDDSSEEEEEEYQAPRVVGGKGFRMPGGKGMGKQLRYLPAAGEEEDDDDDDDDDSDDDSDDDDEEEEEEEEHAVQPVSRGGGKQFGGKQLRPSGGKQLRPA